jgi:hypothetical protein
MNTLEEVIELNKPLFKDAHDLLRDLDKGYRNMQPIIRLQRIKELETILLKIQGNENSIDWKVNL